MLGIFPLPGGGHICNQFFSVDRLYMSESDVYRRQILTYKDGPRAERVKRPQHHRDAKNAWHFSSPGRICNQFSSYRKVN